MIDPYFSNVVLQTGFESTESKIPEQTVFFLSGDTSASTDPYSEFVTTLASFNGANNATTFLDNTGRTWTASDNAKLTTADFKFGTSSAVMDGDGDYFSTPYNASMDFGVGDFTVELWFKLAGASQVLDGSGVRRVTLIGCNQKSSNGGWAITLEGSSTVSGSSGRIDMECRDASGFSDISHTKGSAYNYGQWYHMAFTRSVGVSRFFIDGIMLGSDTTFINKTVNMGSQALYIGRSPIGGYSGDMNGNISDVRITKGVARYTDSFTVPTASPPNVGLAAADATGKAISYVNAVVSPLQKKFGYNTSMRFQGNNSYFFQNNDPVFTFGMDDFTIEMWVYSASNITTAMVLYDGRSSATTGAYPTLYFPFNNALRLQYFTNGGDRIIGTISVPVSRWSHVALCRKSGVTRLFIDGAQSGGNYVDSTNYINGSVNRPLISSNGNMTNGNEGFNGYIQDIVISKGVGKYASNFTPPQTAFTLPLNNYTTPITALPELKGKVLKPWRNPQLSTKSKNGARGMLFDGVSGLVSQHSADFDPGIGDYTIECWVHPTAYNTSNGYFIGHSGSGTVQGYDIGILSSGTITSGISNGAVFASLLSKSTVPLNNWSHIALTKKGSLFSLWLNGALECQISYTNSIDVLAQFLIGAHRQLTTQGFIGYIDDVRVTKGVARYNTVASATQDEFWNTTGVSIPVTSERTPDPLGHRVMALLRMDGLNAGTAFSDETGKAITASGVTTSTDIAPVYGSSSAKVSNGYLQLTTNASDFQFGEGDFTIECWIYMTGGAGTPRTICDKVTAWGAGSVDFRFEVSGANYLALNIGYSTWVASSTTLNLNTWYHVAAVRYGGSYYLYQNGVQVATSSAVGISIGNIQTAGLRLLKTFDNVNPFVGYMDNFRVTAEARYTSGPFTPTDYPHISYFPDAVGSTVTTAMGAKKTAFDKKYGDSSAYFNGSAYLTFSSSPAFNFGTNDFTIDFWIKPLSISESALHDQWNAASGSFLIGQNELRLQADGALRFSIATAASVSANYPLTTAGAVVVNQWQHIAVVRFGGVITIYVGGVSKGSAAFAGQVGLTAAAAFGRETSSASQFFNGYLDDYRVTKAARWTTTFTPPVQESFREAAASFSPPRSLPTGEPTISGVIRDASGAFASRKVYAYDRASGALVGSDISDGATGAYSMGVNSENTFVVALDDDFAPDLNAVVVDRIVPV